jgi:hypothetical protein
MIVAGAISGSPLGAVSTIRVAELLLYCEFRMRKSQSIVRLHSLVTRVARILQVCTFVVTTMRGEGLRLLWQKKVESNTVGAPYDGVIRPSIWAVSFSPDGKHLAVGVGIVKSPRPPYLDYKSYITLISTSQPDDSLARTFEVSAKPWSNGPRIAWSADGKYLAIDHISLLEKNAFVLDTETGHEYAIPRNNCSVLGLVPGPRLLIGGFFVQKVIRLVNLNGAAEWEWPISSNVAGAGFAVSAESLALAIGDPDAHGVNVFREFALVRAIDHSEIMRWPFSGSWGFSGALSASASVFCGQFYEPRSYNLRRIVCRELPSGNEIGSVQIALGQRSGSRMLVGGRGRVAVEDGPGLPGTRSVWDVRSGRRLAHWSVPVQKVLPKSSWPAEYLNSKVVYPYAISPDGTRIVEGGSGVITLYGLPQ